MVKRSAGLLLYRRRGEGQLEVLLAHPGGPFWAYKDNGAWSIPKGEYLEGEGEPHAAALREFEEELGKPAPEAAGGAPDLLLGEHRQSSGKIVVAWAREGDYDADNIDSNIIEMTLRNNEAKVLRFPEVDRAGWFTIAEARVKLHKSQVAFLDDLLNGC